MPPKNNSYNVAARKRTSTLPQALRTELEELGKIAPLPNKSGKLGRKDRRKDQRNESKVNRAKNQSNKRSREDEPLVQPTTKKVKKESNEKKSVKFNGLPPPTSSPPPPSEAAAAPKSILKKQTPLEKLLAKQEGRNEPVDVIKKKGKKNLTDEDKEIAWLEAKLGLTGPPGQLTKKDKGKWKEEFAEDGLDGQFESTTFCSTFRRMLLIPELSDIELFEGMDDLEAAAFGGAEKVQSRNLRFLPEQSLIPMSAQDYAKLLKESGDFSDLEFDEDEQEGSGFDSEEDGFAGILSEDEDQARIDEDEAFGSDGISDEELEVPSDDDDHREMGELGSSEEEDDSEGESEDDEDIESEFEGSELSFNEGDEEDESGAMTMTFGDEPTPVPSTSSAPTSTSTTGRYVPPHLRNKESSTTAPLPPSSSKPSDSLEAPPDDPRLRRLLNGHLNKLSPPKHFYHLRRPLVSLLFEPSSGRLFDPHSIVIGNRIGPR